MASTETIYEAPPPPDIPVDPAQLPPNLQLTDAEKKIYDDVLKHFERADYALADIADGALTEEEKFWLVRSVGAMRSRGY